MKEETTTEERALALKEFKVGLAQGNMAIKDLSDQQYLDIRLDNIGEEAGMKKGSYYIRKTGEIIKVTAIKVLEPQVDWNATNEHYKDYEFVTRHSGRPRVVMAHENGELKDEDLIWIRLVEISYKELLEDEPPVWGPIKTETKLEKFFNKELYKLEKPVAEYQAEGLGLIQEGVEGTDKYADNAVDFSSGTALMGKVNTKALVQIKDELAVKQKHVSIIAATVERTLLLKKREMDRMVAELNNKLAFEREKLEVMKSEMYGLIRDFKRKIKQLNEIISVIELYLGVHEQVVHIQEGPTAPAEELVNIYQQLLFMDEEVGDPRVYKDGVGGIHFGNIEMFDQWLCQPKNDGEGFNYERLIPQAKGIVALQISRQEREYYTCGKQASFWDVANTMAANRERNAKDRATYILIRNGFNLYRVMSSINFQPRMFPLRDEFEKHLAEIRKYSKHGETDEEKRDRIDDEMYEATFPYMKKALMLEGILHRTPIFHPVPEGFSFNDSSTHEKFVRFVQDDVYVLPDGRKKFKQWHSETNARITRGTRVVIVGSFKEDGDIRSRLDERFQQGWDKHKYSLPPQPQDGIYTVEQEWEREEHRVRIFLDSKRKDAGDFIRHERMVTFHGHHWSDSTEVTTKDLSIEQQKMATDYLTALFADPAFQAQEGEKDHAFYWKKVMKWHWKDGLSNWDMRTSNEGDPKYGTYEVYKELRVTFQSDKLYILYNPKDTVYGGWGQYYEGERKNRIRFIIRRDDRAVLNYDQIDLSDIDYYLKARHERINYMWLIRSLWEMRDQRTKEEQEEQAFIKWAILDRMDYSDLAPAAKKAFEDFVPKAVEWWKFKVINKRPITEDNAKALRMIRDKCEAWLEAERS
jgi:hypothetical protein